MCRCVHEAWLDAADLYEPHAYAYANANTNACDAPCVISRNALIIEIAVVLLLHGVTLGIASLLLARSLLRTNIATCVAHFAPRYLVLVFLTSAFVLAFNVARLVDLTTVFDTDDGTGATFRGASMLRAGGSQAMNALAWFGAIFYIAVIAFSVQNTMHATVAAQRKNVASLPWYIRRFSRVALALAAWNGVVWALLFIIPSQSGSESSQWTIAVLIIVLGNSSYFVLASAVVMATRKLADEVRVSPAVPASAAARRGSSGGSVGAGITTLPQPSDVSLHPTNAGATSANLSASMAATTTTTASSSSSSAAAAAITPPTGSLTIHVRSAATSAAAASAGSGLNASQLHSRQRAARLFGLASLIIRHMKRAHTAVTIGFAICVVAVSEHRVQSYWLYTMHMYWAIVLLFRLSVLKLPGSTDG